MEPTIMSGTCQRGPDDGLSVDTDERLYCVSVQPRYPVHRNRQLAETFYRLFEILTAAIALILFSPVMAIVALAIVLESPGPVLFRQLRTARSRIVRGRELAVRTDVRPAQGEQFEPDGLYYVPAYLTLVKFRTMHADARTRFPELYEYRYDRSGFLRTPFKRAVDPRVTKLGHLLRKSSLDELPNLLSVLTGDLRLVGPRPEHPALLKYYSADQMYKFSVNPGVTGLAQASGRSDLTQGETIACDLQYVATRGVCLDMKILMKTVWIVVSGRGAY